MSFRRELFLGEKLERWEKRTKPKPEGGGKKKKTLPFSKKKKKLSHTTNLVGLLMALTLHFGNVVYLYLTVSFIQMLKALTPVVTMGKSSCFREAKEKKIVF